MIYLEIEIRNLEETLAKLAQTPGSLNAARRRGLQSAISYLRGAIFDWIQSEGEGHWPGSHPLSQKFQKKPGGRWGRRSRALSRANWNWLMRFVNTWQARSNLTGGIKFGKAEDAMRGTTAERALRVEKGHRTIVSPKMHRLMGATRSATRGVGKFIPGVDYFPLRKSTAQIILPPRPIIAPVFAKERARAIETFVESFNKEVENRT